MKTFHQNKPIKVDKIRNAIYREKKNILKNNTDQTCSCPRDWYLCSQHEVQIQGPIGNPRTIKALYRIEGFKGGGRGEAYGITLRHSLE